MRKGSNKPIVLGHQHYDSKTQVEQRGNKQQSCV